jgi:hypothetical protein
MLNLSAMTTFADRLRQAMVASEKTAGDLARVLRSSNGEIGASRQSVYQVLNGQTNSLNAENTLRAARLLGCDPWWLATGGGTMTGAKDDPEAFLLRAYRQADDVGRQQMLRIIAAGYPQALAG